jgi:hypothetical protein
MHFLSRNIRDPAGHNLQLPLAKQPYRHAAVEPVHHSLQRLETVSFDDLGIFKLILKKMQLQTAGVSINVAV